jgi:hypothetical protein
VWKKFFGSFFQKRTASLTDRLSVRGVRNNLLWPFAQVLIASHFALAYIDGTSSWIDLTRYTNGTERVPFQYRILTAWLLRAGEHLPGLGQIAAHASRKMADPLTVVWAILACLSTLWIIRSAGQAASLVTPVTLLRRLLALSIMVPIYIEYEAIANGYRLSYAYDLPSLALYFACLIAIMRRQPIRMMLLFILATLARETAIFLIPIFLCWELRHRDGTWRGMLAPAQRPAWALAGAMAVIWLGIKLALNAVYAGNPLEPATAHLPGAAFNSVWQLDRNMMALINPMQWPVLASSLCWLWLPVIAFWRLIGDARLRSAILVTTPLTVATMMVVGRIMEPRVFAELGLLYWLAVMEQGKQFFFEKKTHKTLSP